MPRSQKRPPLSPKRAARRQRMAALREKAATSRECQKQRARRRPRDTKKTVEDPSFLPTSPLKKHPRTNVTVITVDENTLPINTAKPAADGTTTPTGHTTLAEKHAAPAAPGKRPRSSTRMGIAEAAAAELDDGAGAADPSSPHTPRAPARRQLGRAFSEAAAAFFSMANHPGIADESWGNGNPTPVLTTTQPDPDETLIAPQTPEGRFRQIRSPGILLAPPATPVINPKEVEEIDLAMLESLAKLEF